MAQSKIKKYRAHRSEEVMTAILHCKGGPMKDKRKKREKNRAKQSYLQFDLSED